MVNALFGFFTTALIWLAARLPASPIQALAFGVDGFGGGYTLAKVMGWVNWLIPFNDMYLLLMAWLAAALVFIGVKIALKKVAMTAVNVTTLGTNIFEG